MKARSFPAARFLLCGTVFLSVLTACVNHVKPPQTVINPATVSADKHYQDKDAANERIVRLTITPTTQPSASTQPILIPFAEKTIQAPPGASITFESRDTGTPASTDYQESAAAVGASLRSDADKGNFDASAPAISLGTTDYNGLNGGAKGGSARGTAGKVGTGWVGQIASAISGTTFGVRLAWCIGLILILGAGIYALVERLFGGNTDWYLVGGAAAFGVAFIVLGVIAETYPWMYAILALIFLGLVGWYVYRWLQKEPKAAPLLPPKLP